MSEAKQILTHATIVTMDPEYRVISDGAIVVQEGSIVEVGPAKEVLASHPGAEIVDCGGKVMIPGLVNAHTHVPMALLRGLEDDRRLDVWLLGYIMPVERQFVSPEFCRLGTQLACAEMIRGGVTCFADMYYFEHAIAATVAEVGLRGICGETVLKFPAPDADSYEDSIAAAREFIMRWKDHPLIVPAVAPHAPYTITKEILRACIDLATEFDVPLHTHLSETSQEVQQWRETYDMPIMPWVKKQGILDTKLIAAHCVHVDEGEIHTLEHGGAGVVHNPSSNLKLASGFAPVAEMLATGLNVGLGTDGPASNNDLDMFEEMRLATFIAKSVTKDPTALPARQVFEMATSMGARAIHLDHLTGSLETGKRADLALVDLRTLHNYPHFQRDPSAVYSRLVYAAKSSDVTDVMVNGKWLMRDRNLLTLDETSLLEAVEEHAKKIDTFLIEREESVLSKLVAIGGARQEESYEVQVKVRLPDPESVLERLSNGAFEIVRTSHYLQYDTYFSFRDPAEGRLRYREDNYFDDKGEIQRVRYRLTLMGPAAEREYPDSVLLSSSRFIAPAKHSGRFYREYFNPIEEVEIHKDRRRWLLRFGGVELFVNIDKVLKPALEDTFLEIKSRTWSRSDAERKAEKISELLTAFGVGDAEAVTEEYTDLIAGD